MLQRLCCANLASHRDSLMTALVSFLTHTAPQLTMQAHLMHGFISANVDLKGLLHRARRVERCMRTRTRW
jgi:hypothetical protein